MNKKSNSKSKFKQTEIGKSPKELCIVDEWIEFPFQDVIDFQEGPGILAKDFHESGVPLVRLSGVERGSSVLSGCNYLDPEMVDKRWSHYRLREGDILLSTSASLGRIAVVTGEGVGAIPYTGIIRMRPRDDRVFAPFIRYLLEGPDFQRQAEMMGTGSVIRHFGPMHLRQMSVTLPPIDEQRAIAHILGTLDDKIELNQQMNKILEAIGKAIFKHWFIDFEFPNEEGRPYKSSGGEMVYNEELGKEIPNEWRVTQLDEVAEFTRGFSYKGSEKSKTDGEYVFVTLNSVKEGGGFKREFSYITTDRTKEKHFVHNGEIVIANTEQTKTGTLLGCPALVEFPLQYEKDKGVFSHHITKAITKLKNLKYYLYYYLFINQQNAVKYNTGSVIWALDVSNWSKNEKIILPHQEVLLEFESLMESMFLKSLENNLQIETLSRLRDSLLPKLMSGKIRVPVEVK